MASGSLPKPGKVINGLELGPCIDEQCIHRDCAETRKQAATLCTHCNKPIGYEVHFFKDGNSWEQLIHRDCFLDKIEQEKIERENEDWMAAQDIDNDGYTDDDGFPN